MDEFDNYIVPSTIFLSLANAPSVDVLKTVEGITKIEEFGGGRFRIHFSDAQEVMERLVEQSSANRWHMSEMRLEKSSLDSIFAELSKKAR